MSRKRKSDKESTENAIATEALAPAEAAVAEPPVVEAQPDGQSFADKVGKKKFVPAPDPYPIASDADAGVRFYLSKQDQWMAIKFGDGSPQDKPSQAVLDKMHEAGWKWKREFRIWALPFTPASEKRTHFEAERDYQEVRQLIRKEKGIEAGPEQGIPF